MKTFRAIHGREDVAAILRATREDGAECLAPTHVLEQDGRVMGYGSVGRVALISGWTAPAVDDTESVAALNAMEAVARAQGAQILLVACTDTCRFKGLMAAAGYTEGEKQVTTFYKKVS